jgi:alpha-galactosidase
MAAVGFSLTWSSLALDNGVGVTPAMGYNTWDDFRCGGINASNVKLVADAIVRYKLNTVGYTVCM